MNIDMSSIKLTETKYRLKILISYHYIIYLHYMVSEF